MPTTDQTLVEQLRITDFEIGLRKELVGFGGEDAKALLALCDGVKREVDGAVRRFYEQQASVPEISLLIGDADTLQRLRSAQRAYVIELFSGRYDSDYVNNRLRIGMVHKRIGVEPKLYLAAVSLLRTLPEEMVTTLVDDPGQRSRALAALGKILMFDVTLVFDTYIRCLVDEIEMSRARSEHYARVLEDKVRERTAQLEELTRTDPLTGLLNRRPLIDALARELRAARRPSARSFGPRTMPSGSAATSSA